ncbi:MAG TPA: hypothetical protein VNX60_01265 [Candidatus Acidoferrum sp.]|nr:hypothetical protein [Candidatus Acidoferrum sp.]
MKKLVLLMALALELAICGCGSNTIANPSTNTAASGNWEAQLTGGFDQSSLLNFVTAFRIFDTGPLDISNFNFFNAGKCFANGTIDVPGSRETGTATLITGSADQVTGTFNFKVTSLSPPGNVLTMTGNLTGTSNGTPQVTGTLSNGVVVGTWTLSGGAGDSSCAGSGNFIMCQGTSTCTPTT